MNFSGILYSNKGAISGQTNTVNVRVAEWWNMISGVEMLQFAPNPNKNFILNRRFALSERLSIDFNVHMVNLELIS